MNYDLINQDFAVPEGYYRNQDGDYMSRETGQLWDPYDRYQQSLNTGTSFGIPADELARWQSLADFQGMSLDQYIRSAQGDYTTSQDKYGSTIYSPTSGTVNNAAWPYHNAPDGTENGWMLPLAVMTAGAADMGMFGNLFGTGGGAGVTAPSGALPESYWSMLAEATPAGVPSAATGTVAGTAAAEVPWYQKLMNFLTPSPTSVATSAAGQLLNSGGGVENYEFPDGTFGAPVGSFAYPSSSGSWWDNIFKTGNTLLGNQGLATGLGALGGYLSGTKPTEAQTQSDYPDWLKPFIASGLGAGLNQLNASKDLTPEEKATIARMQQGLSAPNAGLEAANQAMTDTASGKYLDLENNPQWQEMMRVLGQNYNETIRPGTDASFSRAGAMGIGNSAWEEMTARNNRALATGQGAATANVWGQERDKQMNAAGAMPGFQNQYLTGLGNSALQLGNYQRTQPWQGILNYGQLMGNLKGPSTSTQSTSVSPWQTAAGGALTGYSLSNLWK
jgi:hypothetical protein